MLIADPQVSGKGNKALVGARSSQQKSANLKSGHPPRPASSQATTKPPLRARQPGSGAAGEKKHAQQKRKAFNGSATMIGHVSLQKSGAAGPLIDKQLLVLMKQEQGGKSDPQSLPGAFQSQKEKRPHLTALGAGSLPGEGSGVAALKIHPQSSRSLSNLQKGALIEPLPNPERLADFDKQQAFAYNPQGERQPGQARWGKKSANLPRQSAQKDVHALLARATPPPKQVSTKAQQSAPKPKPDLNDSDNRSIHVKSSIGLSEVHASLAALAANRPVGEPTMRPLTQLSQKQQVAGQGEPTNLDLKMLSAYGQKRQSARNYKEKARVQIVGRRVDAPHIIVPQGGLVACTATTKADFAEPALGEQGTSVLLGNAQVVARGHKTISLSPKHSSWKKPQPKAAQPTSSYAKAKNSNSFGQVKLHLGHQQAGQTAKTQRAAATQKQQLKNQPGKTEGGRARNAKSVEHVRPSRGKADQQAPAGAAQGQTKAPLSSFLDTSLFNGSESRVAGAAGTAIQISNQAQAQHQSGDLAEQKQVTLNILAKTQDQLANLAQVKGSGSVSSSLVNTHVNPMGGQSKSKGRPATSKDISRQLIQTKYLNFQQSAVSNPSKKRGASSKERQSLNKTGQAHGTQQPREKRGVANPFGRLGSSQRQVSSGAAGHKAKGMKGVVNKNKTVELELRKRSRSKQGTSMVLSDTPSKERASQKRARSGGSSNQKGKGLGVSSSFSPKSRQTQFAEARSLLFENQSSGLSVNSKKQQNLNQLLNQRDAHSLSKRPPTVKLISSSQEQITAAQSSSLIQGQAGATGNPSYINLDLQPQHNVQGLLIAPENSVQQIHVPDAVSAAEMLAEVLLAQQSDSAQFVERKAKGSQPRSSLNVSLGKIVRHGDNTRKRGGSQSPKGNKWANKGASRPQTQMGKTTAVISAVNTSRIDRIIQENLKKQNKKTLQRKIREQEEEQVTRKKKAELEQVNEKIRNANKEKVQRRKQHAHGLPQQPDVRRIKTKNGGGAIAGSIVHHEGRDQEDVHNSLSDGYVPPQQSETVSSCLATIRPFAKGGKLLRFKNQRKSNGLDFIDIRREINAEMKQFGVKKPSPRVQQRPSKRAHLRFIGKDRSTDLDGIDSSMLHAEQHLRASKSQRQMAGAGPTQKDAAERYAADFSLHLEENGLVAHNQSATLKTGQGHLSAHLRLKQTIQEKLHAQKLNQSMTNGLHTVLKKEKIRKFMVKKQKQKQEAQERSKQEEIQKTLKVHQNLLNLDKQAKKRLKVVSSAATSGLQSRGNVKAAVNASMSGVMREKSRQTLQSKKNMTLIHDRSECDRTLVSAAPNDQVLTMTPSKMPSEATEPQFNVSAKPHSRTRSSKQFKKGLLRQHHQLDPSMYMHTDNNLAELTSIYKQDERSSSCKRGGRKSSQSRATDIYANRSCNGPLHPQFENSTSAKALRTQLRQQDPSSAQPTPGAATNASRTEQSAVNKSLLSRKSTRQQLKSGSKHNVKNLKIVKRQQNPPKPINIAQPRKRGKSLSKKHGAYTVAHSSKLNVKVPEASILAVRRPRHAQQHAAHQLHNSAHRSSVHTLESHKEDGFSRRGSRHRHASSFVSSMNMSKDLAAKVIQKEVRKYLKQIGFYHARQIPSPDREPQISLFIERRKASRSKDSKRSKSRSGSRGIRQSPQLPHSDALSPQRLLMQETTVVAELSGVRQADIFGPESCSESDGGAHRDARLLAHERNDREQSHERGGKTQPASRQRSSHKSKVNRSGERDALTSSKREKSRKSSKPQAQNQPAARLTEPDAALKGPLKQLDPIFQMLPSEEEEAKQGDAMMVASLMEIKSVQTPPSRENVVTPLEMAKSDKSLSANRISCSEFEFRQLQSSVESKPSSSVDRILVTAQQQPGGDGASQSSSSLFDRNAFQQYSHKKLKVLLQESEHSKLIKFREEILRFKEQKERKHIRALFKQKKCSPRSYQAKQKQIDRWVWVERQEIEKSKSTFKEEWEKTVQMIEDTQKNVNQMRSKMNLGPSSTGQALAGSVVSGTSTHKPGRGASGGVGGTNTSGSKMLNNFNSQSCNSLSSQPGYQKNTNSNGLLGNNLMLSGAGAEHQRSILMEDPPKSYRSGRQEVVQKVPVLQLGGGICPEQIAEDIAAGSLGMLSSRRSVNGGAGLTAESGPAAQSLLQYMEQRLASHTEQRQASLGDLKQSSVDSMPAEIPIEIQDLGEAYLDVESGHKSKTSEPEQQQPAGKDQATVKATATQELPVTAAQQHSRKQSSNSVPESEVSHQPSAEFLERLEKVNKQEPFISSTMSENLLGSGNFTAIEGVLMPAAGQPATDGAQLQIEENQFTGETPAEEVKSGADGESEKVNFKNQVMTIKDFGLIDSKRTSNQSETSNEKEFNKMLSLAQAKGSRDSTPSAEKLQEPSLLGKQSNADLDGDNATAVKSPLSNGDSIRISEMLKMQADLGDLVPGSQQQQPEAPAKEKSDEHSETDSQNLLQEPAIISSSQTLEVPQPRESEEVEKPPQESVLIAAKTKPAKELSLDELQAKMQASPAEREKVVEQLTDLLVKQLVEDCSEVPARAKAAEEAGSQQASHDVYYVDQLQSEKEEKKEWIELRQRHLIENDLIRIDQYVNEIVDALLQFEIDLSSEDELLSEAALRGDAPKDKEKAKADAENYHVQFLKQLTQPIFKKPSEVLQTLQTSEIGSYKHFETTQDLSRHPIIPVDLYLEIEKAREEAMLARKGAAMSKQTQMVWESIHIQNKSFFDAINESLMKFRPYGLTGEPMPWSNKVRRLQTKVDISSVDTERLFQMVKQEVFRWAQAFCGALPSPVFCFPPIAPRPDKEEFNEDLFQENREKRLTQILSAETVEQEHHWLNYEYEEAQVKIDLSDMILEHLVDELVSFLNVQFEAKKGASQPPAEAGTTSCQVYEVLADEPDFAPSAADQAQP